MAIVGYWRLNGNSNDASGNGYNGTDTSITYSQANGRLNQGAGFNGSSSKIVLTNTAILRPTYLTIMAWIKTTENGNWKEIFQNSYTGGVWSGFEFRKTASNTLNFNVRRNVSGTTLGVHYQDVNSTKTINDGLWHHVAATIDGSYIRVFIDGVMDGEVAWAYGIGYDSSNNRIRIGVNNYVSSSEVYFWNGSIDEVALDNTPWTPSAFKNKYAVDKGFF